MIGSFEWFQNFEVWGKNLAIVAGFITSGYVLFRFLKVVRDNIKKRREAISEFFGLIPELRAMVHQFGVSRVKMATFESCRNGLYIFVSEEWCEITGLTCTEALGKGWLNAFEAGAQNQMYQEWLFCVNKNQEFNCTSKLETDKKEVSIRAWPVRNLDGSVEKYLGVLIRRGVVVV